jgi:glyoxylase-like metal-dependent hydrolase (beta-lactamase superfamily II)
MPGLGHVNTYAMEDARGVTLVDPGLPGDESWGALLARLASAGLPLRRVHTVVITHSHPDHYGGVNRLVEETGTAVLAHEAFQVWLLPHEHPVESEPTAVAEHEEGSLVPPWLRLTPWAGTVFDSPRALEDRERAAWYPPPPTERLVDGQVLRLAGRDWFVRHTPGHTVDHVCLHDPTEGVLLSGDHILPTITPHISGLPPGVDPLAAFFSSLDAMAALPGVHRVLPAHGHPFADLTGRVDAIKTHHEERLQALADTSAALGWSTVTDLSHEIFQPRSWGSMADSETYAHLEHLRLLGWAERRDEGGGLLSYLVARGPLSP